MSQPIAVLVVHGMGQERNPFAEEMKALLAERYGLQADRPDAASHLCIEPVQWSHVFESREQKLFDQLVAAENLRYQGLRRFVIHYLADAIAYQPVETAEHNYDAVHHTITEALRRLADTCGPTAPLCVIAHSLGAVIASNYFYDLQYEVRQPEAAASQLERGRTLALFYSMGTTLPLWSLRYRDFNRPISVPSQGLRGLHPGVKGEWVNFYDKDDILGYPLRAIDPAYREAVAEDVEVRISDWLRGWNPLCHSEYRKSPEVLGRIALGLARTWREANGLGE
ncbi:MULTISPECIES: chemotaxis protein [Paenibacillus]|uniref:chemotaxis protein n=1 Tax=Paenibacillus TaxID=44249 RepID=UPI0022B865E6|nr:chemotaxis protein [Paenibacillus caseinilyticus]MCZ8519920.1 chemotaxis protein [Paenibacillus caseinilyticus]